VPVVDSTNRRTAQLGDGRLGIRKGGVDVVDLEGHLTGLDDLGGFGGSQDLALIIPIECLV